MESNNLSIKQLQVIQTFVSVKQPGRPWETRAQRAGTREVLVRSSLAVRLLSLAASVRFGGSPRHFRSASGRKEEGGGIFNP